MKFLTLLSVLIALSAAPALAGAEYTHGPLHCWSSANEVTEIKFPTCWDNTDGKRVGTYGCSVVVMRSGHPQKYAATATLRQDPRAASVTARGPISFKYDDISCIITPTIEVRADKCTFTKTGADCLVVLRGGPGELYNLHAKAQIVPSPGY